MTGLQEAFYIVSIVFMGIMFIIMFALVIAVLVIRTKVNKLHDIVEEKLDSIVSIAEKGGTLTALAGSKVISKASKAIRKKK